MAMGEYIKWRIFHDSNPKRKVRNRRPIKDHVKIAQILSLLGRSNFASNLQELRRLADYSILNVTPDVEQRLVEALDDVRTIRILLTKALGMKVDE